MLITRHKYLFSLLLIIIPVLTHAQDVNGTHTKTPPPDTIKNDSLNDYEIIYQYDTIRQTKTIIDYDTIIQYNSISKEIYPDTSKPILSKHDSIIAPPVIPYNTKEKHFFTGIYFSTHLFSNNLSVHDSSANTQLNFRKAYEKPMPSFSLAITSGYKLNRWSIQSGVQYSQLRNKYNYPFQNEKHITSTYMQDTSYSALQNDTIDSYYQVSGPDTTWFYVIHQKWVTMHDSVPKTKTDTAIEERIKKGVQYYHYIEIPLIFGYEFLHYKKLRFEIKAGAIASFIIYSDGKILSDKGSQTVINLSEYPFVSTFFSGYFGLGINYELSKKMNIEIHPYYQKSFSSVLQKSAPLSQGLDKKGVYVGLKYKF